MMDSSVDGEAFRLMRLGRIREALPLAERAVAGAVSCLPGHAFLASLYRKSGRPGDAESVIARALEFGTGSAEAYDALAYVSLELSQHERANALYRRATEVAPGTARYWYNLATSERSFGRLAEAETACERSIALDPGQHPTYLLRSELRVQTPAENHIAQLKARFADGGLDVHGRAFLGYALAKELDDVQRVDEAFACFAAAAAARRSQISYDVAGDERMLARIAQVFAVGASWPAGAPRPPGPSARNPSPHIFIVGLPRSGTTLVERILSGLPGVRSNGETENLSRALTAAAPRSGGDVLERAAAADPAAVAAHYDRLAGLSATDDRVIEKLPTNYLYLGAIRRALPDARIILVHRAPLDSCFAMYRTLFGQAYPFTYDFDELARYAAAYARLIAHWQTVLGAALYEVVYEELVREPQRVGAALAAHLHLEWSPDALDVPSNRSVSLTASSAQVRRPIYGTSSGRWRRYRAQLAPLIAALRRHGVPVPADA